jgi:hypothetical protein
MQLANLRLHALSLFGNEGSAGSNQQTDEARLGHPRFLLGLNFGARETRPSSTKQTT